MIKDQGPRARSVAHRPPGDTPFAAYEAFHAAHADHGLLVAGTDEPEATGYRAWAACPCGAAWMRWITLDDVLQDWPERREDRGLTGYASWSFWARSH